MIEQLKAYLSDNTCDYERDSKHGILLDEDRIQIYFSIDEDYCVTVTEIELFDQEGNDIELSAYEMDKLISEVEDLLNEWVKPSDNTVVIEGGIYE